MSRSKKGTKITSSKNTNSEALAEVKNQNSGDVQKLQIPTFISVESTIGAISILAMKSPSHKYLFLSDYEWLVLPAIATKQFVLFRGVQNEPVAFISWASVSNNVEQRLTDKNSKLQPADWKSGDNIYIIDIISPFGPSKNLLKQVNEKYFQGKDAKILRPRADGKGLETKLLRDLIN